MAVPVKKASSTSRRSCKYLDALYLAIRIQQNTVAHLKTVPKLNLAGSLAGAAGCSVDFGFLKGIWLPEGFDPHMLIQNQHLC